MKRPGGDAMSSAVLLALALVLLAETLRFGPASRLVPLSVLVPLVAMLLWCLTRAFAADKAKPVAPMPRGSHASDARLIGWILALPLLATMAGPVVGPALFVGSWLRLRGRERWLVVGAGTGLTAATLLLLIAALLDTMPALAALPPWLAR
jgi:hypothetical protein